jgi:hypothetical protein
MGKWGLDCDYNCNSAIAINNVKSRWVKARSDLEDAKYLESLIFRDFVGTVKKAKTVWDYRIPMLKAAQSEIGKKTKKERENLSYIESQIKDTFFKDENRFKVKIHNIVSGGYEGYYWQVHFKINKDNFIIQIPNRDALDITNFNYAYEGKFVFYKSEGNCTIAVQCDDWTEEGFAKCLKKYFYGYFSDKAVD